jgi:hypothetical protein
MIASLLFGIEIDKCLSIFGCIQNKENGCLWRLSGYGFWETPIHGSWNGDCITAN